MSSGACRALVAVLLTLVATIVMALPVVADTEELTETSNVIYRVDPAEGTISVTIAVTLRPRARDWQPQTWRELSVEEGTRPSASGDYQVTRSRREKPGLWEAVGIRTPEIEARERDSFSVRYTLNASTDKSPRAKRQTPARLNDSYMYFCVTGQDTDSGDVQVRIDRASRWDITILGSPMDPFNDGFRSTRADGNDPGDIFTCFEGVREPRLDPGSFIGPDDRPIQLQAWKGDSTWLIAAEQVAAPGLRNLREFIGHEIPGEGPVVIRMAPTRDIGGYAGAHDTPGIVQLSEFATNDEPIHQLAHAWYGTDNFREVWLREGMAEWTASTILGEPCAPVTDNPDELELYEWMVVQPQSPVGYDDLIAAQETAACGIVAAVRERVPREQWDEVVVSMLRGETKYISSAGPEIGSSTGVDYREWLDAIDERGLVPAAADPEYAANLEDLDFAQDLLETFGVMNADPGGGALLALRSEAREKYHEFLGEIAPLSAPWAVRNDMDDWEFRSAMARIEKSRETYTALSEANALLPEADLITIVQPQFEAARSEAELEDVEELVSILLEGSREVADELGELQEALPPNWRAPVAVTNAIRDRRFDDIMAAVDPAITAAQEITAADRALPQAGFLQKYKARFESTATAGALDDVVDDAKSDRLKAERAGRALEQLQTEVGDWTIPAAVTDPLENGQLEAGERIIEDAQAVVTAATNADRALPEAGLREDTQPRFEAVTNGAEMAALRAEVERQAADVEAVGNALSTLDRLVGDWTIPAIVAAPIEAGRFADAKDFVEAAEDWVTAADEAQRLLPELNALESIRADFEGAQSLTDLRDGAALAERQEQAAALVREAKAKAALDRDLLTNFGLWGVDVDAIVDEAVAAAIAGDVQEAINKSADAISKIDGGAGAGSLRLAGLVFFGVAVLGVLGLWVMLRRQHGPSWARSTTPHWIEERNKRGLLGRGRKKDEKDQKDKKG